MYNLHFAAANDLLTTVASNHYYESMAACGVIALWSASKATKRVYRAIFHTTEERNMTQRLRMLNKAHATANQKFDSVAAELAKRELLLKTSDSQINAIRTKASQAQGELDAAKNQIRVERAAWIKERETWDKNQGPCPTCNSTKTSLFCGNCGLRQRSAELPYVDQPFDEVNTYLHSIARWGKPMEPNGGIVLPWPTKGTVTFTVGDVKYKWSKEDSEDYDGEWYGVLEWKNPILGNMKLVNKIQGDNAHEVSLVDTDTDYEMTSGSLEELERLDVAMAVEQTLTAMACWMQSKRIET
jgi:hypothetical protein